MDKPDLSKCAANNRSDKTGAGEEHDWRGWSVEKGKCENQSSKGRWVKYRLWRKWVRGGYVVTDPAAPPDQDAMAMAGPTSH
jgi:hypothetical protein